MMNNIVVYSAAFFAVYSNGKRVYKSLPREYYTEHPQPTDEADVVIKSR